MGFCVFKNPTKLPWDSLKTKPRCKIFQKHVGEIKMQSMVVVYR